MGSVQEEVGLNTHTAAAHNYALDVVAGRSVACKWTRLACQRHLRDIENQGTDAFPYVWDEGRAAEVCDFIEMQHHIKGEWARRRERIKLEPWQQFGLCSVFGWVHVETGLRRFKTSYEEVARKNAKSTKSSGVGLYMLAADGEAGAEVYSAATTRDQAKIVFSDAQNMARRNPEMCDALGIRIGAHNINVLASASKFEALSAEGSTLDGLNVHCAIVDELHAHKTRAVYDVLETATGSRSQPLVYAITTAGSDRSGICYEIRTYLTKILEGVVQDDSFWGIIYTLDDADEWSDPAVWPKANPNLGVSVSEEDMARLCRKAMEMPSARNNFLTKRLNVWVNADVAWMDMRAWDRCAVPALDMEDFQGAECIDAVDLATKVDIAAHMRLFWRDDGTAECLKCRGSGKIERDGFEDEECPRCAGKGESAKRHYYAFGRYYLPEAAVQQSRNSQYPGWEAEGRLVVTPGDVTDIDTIEDDIKEDASRFQIREVAFDPFQAQSFANHMIADGFEAVEMRPTVLNFSEPMKELEALVYAGRFHHDGDPVLGWMVSNVVAHRDKKGNIYPNKEREENKIDGVVALIMALGRATTVPEKRKTGWLL